MEHNGYDDLNWRRNGPTQVVCVEPAYDEHRDVRNAQCGR